MPIEKVYPIVMFRMKCHFFFRLKLDRVKHGGVSPLGILGKINGTVDKNRAMTAGVIREKENKKC